MVPFPPPCFARPAPRRLPAGLLLLALVLPSVLGCESDDRAPLFVDLVSPDGGDPTEGTDVDTLVVRLRKGTAEPVEIQSPIAEATLDIVIDDLEQTLVMTVELTGPTDRLVGAPPVFAPIEGGRLRIPMGVPGSCAPIGPEGAWLEAGRTEAGVAQAGTFALVAGGVSGAGPSDRAEALDLLQMLRSAGEIDDLPAPAGPARAVALDRDRVLVVTDAAGAFVYDLSVSEDRASPLTLHAGADAGSALVSLPDGGAVVVGGGAAPSDGVTWVTADGSLRSATLAAPRARPAAALVGGWLLVAGGMADGGPLAEVLGPGDAAGTVAVEAAAHGVRDGAVLVSREGRAWLLGGTDAGGVPRTDTLLLTGCPDACAATAGPAWPDARSGLAVVPTPEGAYLVGGGPPPTDRVELARLDTAVPSLETPFALAAPRTGPGAFRLASGILAVVAGRGPDGLLDTFELCFPQVLEGP